MQLIDWILVVGSLLLVLGIGLYTQLYMRSVADFMSAGRVARRYLLAVGRGEMGAGAVVFVGAFEQINHSGFSYGWWGWLPQPLLLVVAIFGFVVYRYRETRVMTLGQFFEIRYSKKLRLFAGFLGFFAGLLNFGIIPVIGARAMVYFLGFSPELHLLGLTIPTYIVLMAVFLAVNLFVTLSGGPHHDYDDQLRGGHHISASLSRAHFRPYQHLSLVANQCDAKRPSAGPIVP